MQSEGLIFFSSNSLLCATLLYRKPQKSEIFGAASQDGGLLLTGGKGLFKGLLLTGGKGREGGRGGGEPHKTPKIGDFWGCFARGGGAPLGSVKARGGRRKAKEGKMTQCVKKKKMTRGNKRRRQWRERRHGPRGAFLAIVALALPGLAPLHRSSCTENPKNRRFLGFNGGGAFPWAPPLRGGASLLRLPPFSFFVNLPEATDEVCCLRSRGCSASQAGNK